MNPSAHPFTLFVLGLTVLTSLAAFSSPRLMRQFLLSPRDIREQGRWYQLLTSGFLHADLTHLLMNMLTLYFFGPSMEQVLGGPGFLILYLGSLLAGSLAATWFHRRDPDYRALGASGAVSGVLFGFILFRPFASIYVFLIPVGIPAILFAVLYVSISIFGMRKRLGRIGHEAHLGGALGGILLTILLYPEVISIFLSQIR